MRHSMILPEPTWPTLKFRKASQSSTSCRKQPPARYRSTSSADSARRSQSNSVWDNLRRSVSAFQEFETEDEAGAPVRVSFLPPDPASWLEVSRQEKPSR